MTARLLTIMGSGETAPTMVKVHRAAVARVPAAPPALLLDTPFGFQMNADELATRTVAYFAESVGATLDVAGLRSASDLTGPDADGLVARIAAAPLVFSGPGSPTYALRTWQGTLVPGLLREKLQLGGAVTFSSAAALTLGSHTVPVYEIYKVGEKPRWEPGLDLLTSVDPRLRAAVVPHFDNAEGGTHDTRFCYLGEQRLAALERLLPDDTWVLGIDEHTALVVDADAAEVTVTGLGALTLRRGGRSAVLPSGTATTLDDLVSAADDLTRRFAAPRAAGTTATAAGTATATDAGTATATDGQSNAADRDATAATANIPTQRDAPAGSPVVRAARQLQERFDEARSTGGAVAMAGAVLDLEAELWAWRSDPTQTDDQDRARATLRAMVGALGEVAVAGTRDPTEVVGPYVELALALRAAARADRRFADADAIRDGLSALGVEVRDTAGGVDWVLHADGASGVAGAAPGADGSGPRSC